MKEVKKKTLNGGFVTVLIPENKADEDKLKRLKRQGKIKGDDGFADQKEDLPD